MKLNKTIGRVATTLVATAMLASLAAPAYAVEFGTSEGEGSAVGTIDSETPISAVTFTKTLSIPENVPVPTVTFNFTMAGTAGDGETVTDNTNTIAVSDGTDTIPANADGNKVITASVSFDESDSKVNNSVSDTVTFELGSLSFSEPGVYKYTVTETEVTGYTTASTHYLYLYVENVSGYDKPQVTGAVLKDNNGDKTATVANTYDSNGTLKVTKKLDGDMANASETFAFVVTVKGDEDRPITAVNTSDATVTISEWDETTGWTVTTELGDDDTLTIYGLSNDDAYTIDETAANTDSYVTTIDTNHDGVVDKTEKADVEAGVSGTYTTETGNIDVVYTNARKSVTPTGIVMNVAPYALLVVIAAAGCFVFLRKRRED